jgi:hypothetical protein
MAKADEIKGNGIAFFSYPKLDGIRLLEAFALNLRPKHAWECRDLVARVQSRDQAKDGGVGHVFISIEKRRHHRHIFAVIAGYGNKPYSF